MVAKTTLLPREGTMYRLNACRAALFRRATVVIDSCGAEPSSLAVPGTKLSGLRSPYCSSQSNKALANAASSVFLALLARTFAFFCLGLAQGAEFPSVIDFWKSRLSNKSRTTSCIGSWQLFISVAILAMSGGAWADINNGLRGYWSFDACSAADDSGNGLNGTIYGGTLSCIASGSGKQYSFTGTQWIDLGIGTSQIATNQITVAAKIKLTANVAQQQRIINKQFTNSAGNWGLEIFGRSYCGAACGSTTNALNFHINNGGGINCSDNTTNLAAGTEYHVAATYASSLISLYVNGALVKTCPTTLAIPSSINAPLVIGKTASESFFYFNGNLDEVRFYDRALQASEVASLPSADRTFCQPGAAATNPNSAYVVDSANGTVTDSRSNLMWDQCAYGLSGANCTAGLRLGYSYDTAKAVAGGLGTYKGKTGWRLPSVTELQSLVETCRTGPAINTDAFPNTIDPAADAITTYWSSDLVPNNTSFAKSISFSSGSEINLPRKSSFQFRLVRGAVVVPPVSVTVTYSGGTNGSITPLGPQTVAPNATTTFTVSADAGYTASVGGTCGGTLTDTTYTTNPLTANCTVVASFGTDIDPVCQSVGVQIKTISRVNLDATMNAARAKVVGYGGLKQTYNVTCSNGRFGVVRTPGSLSPGGETYALVQRAPSCVRQDVKIPGPAVTSKTDIDEAILASGDGKSDATDALKANKLIGPLAAEICL